MDPSRRWNVDLWPMLGERESAGVESGSAGVCSLLQLRIDYRIPKQLYTNTGQHTPEASIGRFKYMALA